MEIASSSHLQSDKKMIDSKSSVHEVTVDKERFHILDAIRGFALFGIYLANIRTFSGWDFLSLEQKELLAGNYLVIYEFAETLFVDGKFYTLFSLLFGIGFSLQLARLKASKPNAIFIYCRRLAILLAVGLVHLFGVWFGDILASYAILGFVLLMVRNWQDRDILRLAVLFFLMPFAGHLIFWALSASPDLGLYDLGFALLGIHFPDFQGDFVTLWKNENWSVFQAKSVGEGVLRLGYLFESWRFFKLAFVMLIGLWVGRKIVAGGFFDNPIFFKKTAMIGFGIGLPFGILYTQIGPVFAFAGPPTLDGLMILAVYMFAIFPLGFAYGAVLVLIWQKKQSLLQLFVAPGKMALSNYLLQTIVGIGIFYGIGLGFAGQVSPAFFVSIAALVYACQTLLSVLWLSHFKQGPVEWLWRCATYGKRLPLKR